MVWNNNFNKTVSVIGGAGRQLLALLAANGYSERENSLIGVELTLSTPSGQSLFIGSTSDVTDSGATKGFEMAAGSYDTQRATGKDGDVIDPALVWIYLATDDAVGIRFRAL